MGRVAVAVDRTLRGCLAGAAGAAVWAAQQPLDMRVFGVPYSDTELLGRLLTRTAAWPWLGLGAHVAFGAAFGGVYANLGHALPVAPRLRGPLAALCEHLASWPGTRLIDSWHPARRELPSLWGDHASLWGDHAAFAQATWRHLLLGAVMGELELRLNRRTAGAAEAPVA